MSPTSVTLRQFLREFAICASFSFIIIFSTLHALLHLIDQGFPSELALCIPLAQFWPLDATQSSHLSLLLIFKVTIACTILVFALREIVLTGMKLWRPSAEERDVEKGDRKPRITEKPRRRIAPPRVAYLERIPEVDEFGC
ncbi:hypothetical protein C8R44DRAFT_749630 [Mycena epipterygia]|nr:hypothetical protein C8R44DRAFT_749630 [Mycena epipterygia]